MSSWNEIKLLAVGLVEGQTAPGLICPRCRGGRDSEKSFSITVDNGELVWFCHRASCHYTGRCGEGWFTAYSTDKSPKGRETINLFQEDTVALSEAQLAYFHEKYGLTPEELGGAGFVYVPDLKQVCMPVRDLKNRRRGVVLRNFSTKKIRQIQEQDGAWMAWYSGNKEKCILIMEDQLSALKCSRYYKSGALLGTSLGGEKASEIASESVSGAEVYLLLDPDAYDKALGYWMRWDGIIPRLRAVRCTRDPKYWDDAEIRLLGESSNVPK